MAIRALLQLAFDYGHLFPLALLIIKKKSYLDDFLSGANSIKEALKKRKELIGLLKVGGLSLKKWATNCPDLEDWLPPSDRIREFSIFESYDSTSILGLSWYSPGDHFTSPFYYTFQYSYLVYFAFTLVNLFTFFFYNHLYTYLFMSCTNYQTLRGY